MGTGTLSHDLNRFWHKVRGKEDPYSLVGTENDRSKKSDSEYVWALQDINLEVKEGEVLGIIGKNGAGKSTLLKILSQVTGPTIGEIKINGRIGSLLEVGTGMHPELTGRENIYLNGAILGMSKAEIRRNFDAIVDFAGITAFVDTPFKRYSSGMRVRLGFAVAAFLEPEILIVDEVLAVGDAEFQQRAIGKMKEISEGDGRTVLFVSHNMASVNSLCSRTVVLANGKLAYDGATSEAIVNYLRDGNPTNRYKTNLQIGSFFIEEVGIQDEKGSYTDAISIESKFNFVIRFKNPFDELSQITLRVKDGEGNYLFVTSSIDNPNFSLEPGYINLSCHFPANFFNEGSFFFDLLFVKNKKEVIVIENDIVSIDLVNKVFEMGEWMGKPKGALRPLLDWKKGI